MDKVIWRGNLVPLITISKREQRINYDIAWWFNVGLYHEALIVNGLCSKLNQNKYPDRSTEV